MKKTCMYYFVRWIGKNAQIEKNEKQLNLHTGILRYNYLTRINSKTVVLYGLTEDNEEITLQKFGKEEEANNESRTDPPADH
jgi:hypothetical protein